MKEHFEISTGTPADVKELAAFLREEYPSGEIADEKYLSWEYLSNPSGKAIVSVARNENMEIASQYALAPMVIYADGIRTAATLSLNTLTAEKYRSKGLFISTANNAFDFCAANEIKFTYGVPNSSSYPGFIRRLNFRHIGNLVFMAKPLKPFRILSAMINKKSEKKGEPIEFIFHKDSSPNGISELKFPEDENEFRFFFDYWKKDRYVYISRHIEYFNWRYMQNPLRKYKLFKIKNKGAMEEVVVIRTMHLYGMKVCIVMENLGPGKSSFLLEIISEQAKKNNLDLMIALAASKKNNQYSQLRSCGFLPVPSFLLPQQLPFIIKNHDDSEFCRSKFNDLSKWHFSFGDYDVF